MLRSVLKAALLFVCVVALYLGAAVVGALVPGASDRVEGGGAENVDVILISGPIHYDFLLPADDATRDAFGFAAAAAAGVPIHADGVEWILIGWGAREFYTTTGTYSDVSAHAIWRGIIGDRSVMRVDAVGALPDGLPVERLKLGSTQYQRLLDAVLASFQLDEAGQPHPLAHPGFSPTDAFFEGRGGFNIFRTCNVWVGEVLRKAGVRFGVWTPTPYAVTLSLRVVADQP